MKAKKTKYPASPGNKAICPRCEEMTLWLYLDIATKKAIAPTVGICPRPEGCGYSLSPGRYFIRKRNEEKRLEYLSKTATDMKTEVGNERDDSSVDQELQIPAVVHNNDNDQPLPAILEFEDPDELEKLWSELPNAKPLKYRYKEGRGIKPDPFIPPLR